MGLKKNCPPVAEVFIICGFFFVCLTMIIAVLPFMYNQSPVIQGGLTAFVAVAFWAGWVEVILLNTKKNQLEVASAIPGADANDHLKKAYKQLEEWTAIDMWTQTIATLGTLFLLIMGSSISGPWNLPVPLKVLCHEILFTAVAIVVFFRIVAPPVHVESIVEAIAKTSADLALQQKSK